MPGIVGLITKMPPQRAEAELDRMVAALRHEAFYESGTWIDESLGVYVGWIARPHSFSDGMPLRNETGSVCLFFSGEEYPERETARRLGERGHSINGKRSSHLVHLYEENRGFVESLNGMFHGLLIDKSRGTIRLFNDRIGMHRICYHQSDDAFYFAAEAKAILAARPELRKPDPRGLGEFVACSCVLENRTIFKDIHVLPPASDWVLRNGTVEQKGSYFQPSEWEQQAPLEQASYYEELRDVFSRNLPRYFDGDERIGIALTGGLDTRVIMGWRKSAPQTLPCYTFGGMYRDSQDVIIARQIANLCQQPHQVIEVGEEFLKSFPRYAQQCVYLTEGGVDVYRSSDLFVSEKARQIAPAKIVGTYGSEIVCQAVMFKPMIPPSDLFDPEFFSFVHQAKDTYTALRRVHPVTFAAFRQSPWYHHGVLAIEQSQLTVRSPYLDNDFVRTVYRAPGSANSNGDVRLRLIHDGSPELGRIRTDRGLGGDYTKPIAALVHAILEFSFKAEYAYDYGMPQWLARVDDMFSAFHFERLFLGRHKLVHYRLWYRDSLSDYVRGILLDPRTLSRPYLRADSVTALVQGHLSGNRNYTTEIHKLLTLELLHRLFFDSQQVLTIRPGP